MSLVFNAQETENVNKRTKQELPAVYNPVHECCVYMNSSQSTREPPSLQTRTYNHFSSQQLPLLTCLNH